MSNLTIAKKEADAILDMAIIRFEYGHALRAEVKAFVLRNYKELDFYANGVNPDEFRQWLESQ